MSFVKHFSRALFERTFPGWFQTVQAIRARRYVNRLQSEWGIQTLTDEFVKRFGTTVRHGPFSGMAFTERSTWTNLASKLLGVYEAELHAALARVLSNQYETIVDVGCADGYYAVGLARCLCGSKTHAFDIDPLARRVVREMARLNGVADRVVVRGACTPARLQRTLRGRSFVLSDCEGYEMQLLDPALVPALKHADMIVEFHEDVSHGVTETICSRLNATHEIRVEPQQASARDLPELAYLNRDDADRLLDERRVAGQCWGIFVAREARG
jgi:hypothetical protein